MCTSDKCLYWKSFDCSFVMLCLYVDDILIFGDNVDHINKVKGFLNENFDMKDLGLAKVILGLKIDRTSNGIVVSQSHYVEKILKKYGYFDRKPVSTPYDSSVRLKKNLGESVSQLRYSQLIGSLSYLANCSRPDISYAVGRLSRYTKSPNESHWIAIERVFRYLKGSVNFGLHYSGFPAVLEGYSDANWVSDSDETKATSGYVFTLGGGAVAWKSSKQTVITRSTMDAELVALDKTGGMAEWLRDLLIDIPWLNKPIPGILIHCDSQSALDKVKSKNHNKRSSRHIELRYKILRKLTTSGVITLSFIRSADNLADSFTKGLSAGQVFNSSRGMGLKAYDLSHR